MCAAEWLAKKACRSVHLKYAVPDSICFYNEVTVKQSAEDTFFMACGFRMGYFGIQEKSDGEKVVIFSVWDPGKQDDPTSVPDEARVKVLHKDNDVRIGRFGDEGTGGQCLFNYDWKMDHPYRFAVRAQSRENKTAFSGYFYTPENKQWKHLVTFETITGGGLIRGYNSFIEDFRRDGISPEFARKAIYDNGWVQAPDDYWHRITKATFTADGNPSMNIDAGATTNAFYLATGGETENTGTPLWGEMQHSGEGTPPDDLPDA